MTKTKEQKIADFKKSNKQRRETIAKMNGYNSALEYYMHLTSSSTAKKKPSKIKVSKQKDMLDYVVAFDTTGSMASYLANVRRRVESLIPQMFSQDIDLRMKIVAFGDYCDMSSKTNFGNAYQESQMTNNVSELQNFVKNAKSTNGGDIDEFYELVIKKIVEETPWRAGARKAVLFIADYGPHPIGYSYSDRVQNNQIDWRKEAEKAASKGIAFDTMAILGDSYSWYKDLSKITGGVWMPFKSSDKTVEVVAASAYVRGSTKSKARFATSRDAAFSSGDTELIGTYKSLSELL